MRGIKRFKQYLGGFSLAEMLLVLLIMSFLSMAIAPFVTKKVKKDTERIPHGRFECYYNHETGHLMQYIVSEIGEGKLTDRTEEGLDYCYFEQQERTAFYLVQGIGGGGGGAGTSSPYITTGSNSNTYYLSCFNKYNYSLYNSYWTSPCSGTVSPSISNNGPSNDWSWIKEIWEDPKYTPVTTISMCSGSGAGGWGYSGLQHFIIYQTNPDGSYVYEKDEEGNDTDRRLNICEKAIPSDDTSDPCFAYPGAKGGIGGRGGCTTVAQVPMTFGKPVNRSGVEYYWDQFQVKDGNDAYFTLGNVSCQISGGKKGNDAVFTDSNYIEGTTGEDADISVYNNNGEYFCNTSINNYVAGGVGGPAQAYDTSLERNPNTAYTIGKRQPRNGEKNSMSISQYSVPYSYTYKRGYNYYGKSGRTSRFNMMFFPELHHDVKIYVGRGGNGGNYSTDARNGEDTLLYFDGGTTPFMVLEGGDAGLNQAQGNYVNFNDQNNPIRLNDNKDNYRVAEESDFVAALGADDQTKLQSSIPSLYRPGRGGDGGYSIIRDTRKGGTRTFNGINASSSTADDKFEYQSPMDKIEGTNYSPIVCHTSGPEPVGQQPSVDGNADRCKGQNGQDGAVVIIW